jgi:RNA polymerase sigma-70 factor (ECF subfamily)
VYSNETLLSDSEGKERLLADEQGWIEAARRGDAGAWGQVVQAYQQPIFRLAYLILGDADDAEDIAQETFLRAYHALDRFDPDRPLRPWLMQITTNLCHNWRRSVGRYLSALQNLLRNEPASPTVLQQAEQHLEAEALWKAVRRLRMEDQQVIYLRYFLECSEAETAEALGVAHGTVKSRNHRALARLRALLQKDYPHLVQERSDVI